MKHSKEVLDPNREFDKLKQEYLRQEMIYATYLKESKRHLYGCKDILTRHQFFVDRCRAYKPLSEVYLRLRHFSKRCKISMRPIRESFEKFRRTHNNTLTSIKRYEAKLQRIKEGRSPSDWA
ncbi:serine protease [Helicobacter bizzozeronii]|uniref:serine protease n=1 Tax=Helicobacter bizzozeronii TaxID=56877 RepID=UPI000CF17F11|nr:serine protease [Helicobacter bizzozeronii]